jgi:hypothetical protein
MPAYTAEPASPSEDALNLLANWAATSEADGSAPQHVDDEASRPRTS